MKKPHTIENTRKIPETTVCDNDEEEVDEEANDEFSSYFVDGKTPKGIVLLLLLSFLLLYSIINLLLVVKGDDKI